MLIDQLIVAFDKGLRTVFAESRSIRPIPGDDLPDADLDEAQKRKVAALMRVNHVGEVCAQALYQGQAMTSADPHIKQTMATASHEETEHLAWTAERITAMGGRKSLLNPLWYTGAFAIGLTVGSMDNRWNLGFLAETERQVEAHLNSHLRKIPPTDLKSQQVLTQMVTDEVSHAQTAERLGAAELPVWAKFGMKIAAKVMTTTAYRI